MDPALAPTPSIQPPLFDLLARAHHLPAPATAISFDIAGRSCAVAMADGRLALLTLDDPDAPTTRLRLEADSGRSLIRPREKPLPAPLFTPALSGEAVAICPSASLGYLVATKEGELLRVTPRGQLIPLLDLGLDFHAIATDGAGQVALACGDLVKQLQEEDPSRQTNFMTMEPAEALCFLPDAPILALRCGDTLFLRQPGQSTERFEVGRGLGLVSAPKGDWLAGGTEKGFWLLQRDSGRLAQLQNFPTQPQSLSFSDEAIFVDGAYRLTGWSLASPPFDSPATGALRSGGVGVVLTRQIAAHPKRALIATGRADGSVALVQPNRPDEMVLRHGEGSPVTALHWSPDGLHLAIALADSNIALLTLPPQLFR